jgi:hypothetical protein
MGGSIQATCYAFSIPHITPADEKSGLEGRFFL